MKLISVKNLSRPLMQPLTAGYCDSFLCQLRGFTFRSQISAQEGLILVQGSDSRLSSSIHMMFVWTDLSVVWINSALTVVDVILARQWRPAYISRHPARYVLEFAPQRLSEFLIGDQIAFE